MSIKIPEFLGSSPNPIMTSSVATSGCINDSCQLSCEVGNAGCNACQSTSCQVACQWSCQKICEVCENGEVCNESCNEGCSEGCGENTCGESCNESCYETIPCGNCESYVCETYQSCIGGQCPTCMYCQGCEDICLSVCMDCEGVQAQRPADWHWSSIFTNDTPMLSSNGGAVMMSATEWNNFTAQINSFLTYKGRNTVTFTAAAAGELVKTSQMNAARDAINSMSPPTSVPGVVSIGDVVSASFINGLAASLNSIS